MLSYLILLQNVHHIMQETKNHERIRSQGLRLWCLRKFSLPSTTYLRTRKKQKIHLSHGEKNLSAWVLEGDFCIWFSVSSVGSLVRKFDRLGKFRRKTDNVKVEFYFLCSEVWLQQTYLVVWASVMLLCFAIIPIKLKLDTRNPLLQVQLCKKWIEKNKSQKRKRIWLSKFWFCRL